jgi:hypothetical protein
MSVPEEAITAAAEAAATGWPNVTKATMRAIAATMLEAAAPHMTAAERERTDQLAVLAAEILASYHQTSDGYRGRVGDSYGNKVGPLELRGAGAQIDARPPWFRVGP